MAGLELTQEQKSVKLKPSAVILDVKSKSFFVNPTYLLLVFFDTFFSDGYGFKKRSWKKVSHAPFYVYDVYEDNRLAPHRYVRILGMMKGKLS